MAKSVWCALQTVSIDTLPVLKFLICHGHLPGMFFSGLRLLICHAPRPPHRARPSRPYNSRRSTIRGGTSRGQSSAMIFRRGGACWIGGMPCACKNLPYPEPFEKNRRSHISRHKGQLCGSGPRAGAMVWPCAGIGWVESGAVLPGTPDLPDPKAMGACVGLSLIHI